MFFWIDSNTVSSLRASPGNTSNKANGDNEAKSLSSSLWNLVYWIHFKFLQNTTRLYPHKRLMLCYRNKRITRTRQTNSESVWKYDPNINVLQKIATKTILLLPKHKHFAIYPFV